MLNHPAPKGLSNCGAAKGSGKTQYKLAVSCEDVAEEDFTSTPASKVIHYMYRH